MMDESNPSKGFNVQFNANLFLQAESTPRKKNAWKEATSLHFLSIPRCSPFSELELQSTCGSVFMYDRRDSLDPARSMLPPQEFITESIWFFDSIDEWPSVVQSPTSTDVGWCDITSFPLSLCVSRSKSQLWLLCLRPQCSGLFLCATLMHAANKLLFF